MYRNYGWMIFALMGVMAVSPACTNSNGGIDLFGTGGDPSPPSPPPDEGRTTAINEVEPNDDWEDSSVQTLAVGATAGRGEVNAAGDTDYWKVDLVEGEVISVRMDAVQLDQEMWDLNFNVPRLTLFDTDGGSKLLEHDYGGNTSIEGWTWGKHDLDFPRFLVPSSGTYFLAVTQDDQTEDGGDYVIRILNQLFLGDTPASEVQTEVEAPGVCCENDTIGDAEPIMPGVVHGWHEDGESDFYALDVTMPSILRLEMVAHRNGIFGGDLDYYDPQLRLHNTSVESNDDAFFWDSAIGYKLDTPGTFSIEVFGHSGSRGSGEYFLDVSVTTLNGNVVDEDESGSGNGGPADANPIAYGDIVSGNIGGSGDSFDFFEFDGSRGDMIHVQRFDSGNSESATNPIDIRIVDTDGSTFLPTDTDSGLQITRTTLQTNGAYYVRVGGSGETDYWFDLDLVRDAMYEEEPNDTAGQANPFDANGRAAGVIDTFEDVDFFRFDGMTDQVVRVSIYAQAGAESDGAFEVSGHGSSLEPIIGIFSSDGSSELARTQYDPSTNDDNSGESTTIPSATQSVSIVIPSTGAFTVAVADQSGGFSDSHYYVIELNN